MAPDHDPAVFRADVGDYIGPVTDAGIASIRDVILCPTGAGGGNADDYRAHPPVASPMFRRLEESDPRPAHLGRNLRIDRLSDDEADIVLRACTPRGHNFAPVKQFGQRYTFILDVDPQQWEIRPHGWDPDGVLHDALAMSRLVRDHGFSLEYAARIITWQDGKQVVTWTRGPLTNAFTVRHERDWLTYDEAEQLAQLLDSYWAVKDHLPPRVTRAMWRAEYATSIQWGDVSLPTIVSGLEALLKTERGYATKQFKERATALASEVGVDGVTEEWAESIYDARSDWVHGASVKLFALDPSRAGGPSNLTESQAFRDLATVQDLLRAAIRKAVQDEGFRERFVSDASVRSHWPVERPGR
ncbi:MAG TPA: hypothetical protein VFR97_13210 [Capillimicrobium sp.]|nr:hypothetical protein [Capillimicrobium sp.]